MKKYFLLILLLSIIIIAACNPTENAIQTAIAETEILRLSSTSTFTPNPTFTLTPLPTSTNTPTNTPEPHEARIIGVWAGAMTNKNGEKILAHWTFMEEGVMIVNFDLLNISYGAEWHIEEGRLFITTELDPTMPTYRDIEFASDDVMILTKDETNIRETWTRVEGEN